MRLSKRFVLDNSPTIEGVVRVNHNEGGCSGSSDSCVIRMDSFGRLSAKCYRCGGWYVQDPEHFSAKSSPVITAKKRVALPSDATSELSYAPQVAIDWLAEAYVDREFARRIGIYWSERHKRLYIPAINPVQRWWTGRSWEQNATRYKTLAEDKRWTFGMAHANKDRLTDALWVCEDLLSMYRLADAGVDALALCTTSISDMAVATIAKLRYNKVVLSLDNDNPQVIMANSKIAQRLGWVREVYRSDLSTDPKHYSIDELKERVQ